MKKEEFLQSLNDLNILIEKMPDFYKKIEAVSLKIIESFNIGGKLLIFGNGGSAADAQHMAAEFINRFLKERRPLPAIALSADTSNLTSISNDYSFDDVFSKQVTALAKTQDIVLGISTSGNSKNVYNAMLSADEIGCTSIGLLGGSGGNIAQACSESIIVPSYATPRIQEMHIFIIHTICQIVEDAFV